MELIRILIKIYYMCFSFPGGFSTFFFLINYFPNRFFIFLLLKKLKKKDYKISILYQNETLNDMKINQTAENLFFYPLPKTSKTGQNVDFFLKGFTVTFDKKNFLPLLKNFFFFFFSVFFFSFFSYKKNRKKQ